MKTLLFFAVLLVLLAGCGSKSNDPAPSTNPGIDPTTAILRTWKKTAYIIRTDQGDYKAQLPDQWQPLTFSKDGKYIDGGLGLNGTYSLQENNTKLVMIQNPTTNLPGGFTYTTFLTFQSPNSIELSSQIVTVNPEKVGANVEEQGIAKQASFHLGNQTVINGATVKTVQVIQRFEAQ